MKKHLCLLAFILSCLTSITARTNSRTSSGAVSKEVKVESFHSIATSSSIDLIYTQSSGKQQVVIYTTPSLIDRVRVMVENGVLKVSLKHSLKSRSIKDESLEVHVTAPAVNSLIASSSGDIRLTNGLRTSGKLTIKASSSGDVKGESITCDELYIKASSSGDIKLRKVSSKSIIAEGSSSGDIELGQVTAVSVTANSSSSSEIYLSGKCEIADFSASSSGDVKAKELKARTVSASASSSGDIACYAINKLKANTTSGGDIKYKGTPKQIQCNPKANLKQIK